MAMDFERARKLQAKRKKDKKKKGPGIFGDTFIPLLPKKKVTDPDDDIEPIRVQVCSFRRKKGDDPEYGIARVRSEFSTHDVDWIVDANGRKVKSIWDYRLIEGPMKYLDTDF